MDMHLVAAHVESDVGHVQEVVGEVLFDHIALVAQADHEVIDSIVGIDLHDVPKNRLAADFDHWLGAQVGFFTDAGAKAPGEDDGFHGE